jgi:predicted outer membrane repeat protein
MKSINPFLVAIFLFSCLTVSAQTTYFVSTTSSAPFTGLNWQNAFPSLHDALNITQLGDKVFIREGVYKPDTSDRSKHFDIPVGVSLYGGFLGNETSIEQRVGGNTILSGNIGNQQDSTDNSYTILYMRYPDSLNRVDRINIEDGFAKTDTVIDVLRPELAGGGVFIHGQNGIALAHFKDCTFSRNYAKGAGGAVFVYGDSVSVELNVQFTNCTFIDNRSDMTGAAMQAGYNTKRPVVFQSCRFISTKEPTNVLSGLHMRFYKNTEVKFLNCSFTSLKSVGNIFMYAIDTFKVTFDSCTLRDLNDRCLVNRPFSHGLLNLDFELKNCLIEKDTTAILFNLFSTDINEVALRVSNNIFKENSLGANYFSIPSSNSFRRFMYFDHNQFLNDYNFLPDAGIAFNPYKTTSLYLTNNYFRTYDAAFPWYGHIENNVFGSTKQSTQVYLRPSYNFVFRNNLVHNMTLLKTYQGTWDTAYVAGFTDTIENNIFIHCFDTSQVSTLPYYPRIQNQGVLRNNYTDIPCSQLPNPFTCQQFTYSNNLANQFQNLPQGNFALAPCSDLINKGINITSSTLDFYGNPRISDGVIDVGPTEVKSIILDTMIVTQGTCTNTGRFQCIAPNACGALAYTWLRSDGTSGSGNTQLQAGSYAVIAHDTLGRSLVFEANVFDLSFGLSAQNTPVNCQSAVAGSINLTLNGGLNPYQFQWSDGYMDSQTIRTGMKVGQYTVTVTDANLCKNQIDIQINASGVLTLLLNGNGVKCYGDSTGSVAASPLNGVSPFRWYWNTTDTTQSLVNRPAGDYSVTVSDALGCSRALAFVLNQPDSLIMNVSTIDNSSAVLPNGQIQVLSVSGGTPPYRFLWNIGDTTSFLKNLDAGVYTLKLSDANNCIDIRQFEVLGIVPDTELNFAFQIKVHPNPVSNQLSITLIKPLGFDWELKIYDMHGKNVISQQMSSMVDFAIIPVSTIADGAYNIIVRTQNQAIWSDQIIIRK